MQRFLVGGQDTRRTGRLSQFWDVRSSGWSRSCRAIHLSTEASPGCTDSVTGSHDVAITGYKELAYKTRRVGCVSVSGQKMGQKMVLGMNSYERGGARTPASCHSSSRVRGSIVNGCSGILASLVRVLERRGGVFYLFWFWRSFASISVILAAAC